MGFGLSKLLGALTMPGNLLALAAFLGLVLAFMDVRLGRLLLAGATIGFFIVMTTPLATWLLLPLEQRFPVPATVPGDIAGIIVLGGAIMPAGSDEHGSPQLTQDAERMTVLPGLMRRFPNARLIFTGGSGDPRNPDAREAPYAAQLLADLGVDMGRVTLEPNSRNTWENALFTRDLLGAETRPWLLVTSASHMPRSVGIFRKVGISIIPYPVGFVANRADRWKFGLNLGDNLDRLDRAAHEYRGLLAYHWAGRTDTLFPSP